jgi:hypothetical protein
MAEQKWAIIPMTQGMNIKCLRNSHYKDLVHIIRSSILILPLRCKHYCSFPDIIKKKYLSVKALGTIKMVGKQQGMLIM